MTTITQVYKLRRDFILIGLTGRTGSGCTSVADLLSTEKFSDLKSEHREINVDVWDNDSRKNRIVHRYMQQHWHPFMVIHASNIIFYYAIQLEFNDFIAEFSKKYTGVGIKRAPIEDTEVSNALQSLKDDYNILRAKVQACEQILSKENAPTSQQVDDCMDLIGKGITDFRVKVENALLGTSLRTSSSILQRWGTNIRKFNQVIETEFIKDHIDSPACLARKIDKFINLVRTRNENTPDEEKNFTHIVIDALRNPYEVLYFREKYSAFYLMSISTDEQTRRNKLIEKGFTPERIKDLDEKENGDKDFSIAYRDIDINRCIELSDIHLTHDGTNYKVNRKLTNQIITYLALIRHPGLIPPSPMERVMQIAYTSKLNSGCLSRQVGAVVTNEEFSVMSVGWNTVPQGQTPCSLRCLDNLCNKEDESAFSQFERNNTDFLKGTRKLHDAYKANDNEDYKKLRGVPLAYCFKDIYTTIDDDQTHNQVHTRAVHAEENAILQLAKYGSSGIKGGKLFSTSSCCELCAKKAYQLGIKEIYYIDSYPGITHSHIIQCGSNQPKMILFHGAIGRAYSNLYNPFLPLKDEIEALTEVVVKDVLSKENQNENKDGEGRS